MYLKYARILILLVCAVHVKLERCLTPNNEEGKCIYLHTCTVLFEAVNQNATADEFIQKSLCGGTKYTPKVCCSSSSNLTLTKEINSTVQKTHNVNNGSLLPSRRYCGYQHSDDYFRETNDSSVRITEFPWLAHLRYKSKKSNEEQFLCSGSLINNKYILTTAHCLIVTGNYEINGVRLGGYSLRNQTDCIQEAQFDQECNESKDFGIEEVIPHPNYNKMVLMNDIGLIRLNRRVEYSDYIRPICLPQPGAVYAKVGDVLISSGWGQTRTGGRKEIKKKSLTRVIPNIDCSRFYHNFTVISGNQFCSVAQSNNTDVQCRYDSGGPLMFSHNLQWQQEGVLSFGPTDCGSLDRPDVSSKVVNYLGWIEENLKP